MKKITLIVGIMAVSCSAMADYNEFSQGESGTTYNNYGSGTYYGSDGAAATQIGKRTYYGDGTSSFSQGGSTYRSDGTSSLQRGNFSYGSDGTTCQKVGNSVYCN